MHSPPAPLSRMLKLAADQMTTDAYRSLAKRAIDPKTGTTVSFGYLNQLANGKVKTFPSPGRIGAIATALSEPDHRVRYETVWLAAIIELAPPRDPALLQRLIDFLATQEGAPDMTADQQPSSPEEMLDEAMKAIAAAQEWMARERRAVAA